MDDKSIVGPWEWFLSVRMFALVNKVLLSLRKGQRHFCPFDVESNDANNALVGKGESMVTLNYLN